MSQAKTSEEASTSQAGNDPAARNEQLENIRHLIYFLIRKFEGITKEDEINNNEIDLDRSNIYAEFLSSIFMHLRKMSNPDAAAKGNNHGDIMCSYKKNSHTVSELALEFQEVCSKNGLALEWDFKSAGTLVDALTAFEMSWDESRLYPAKFKLSGPYGQRLEKDISYFGLSNAHLPVLTGYTYKPERRAGLMSTLGPLTLAIMLSYETRVHGMMTKALSEMLKDIPMGNAIVECLKYAKGPEECRSLFRNLGDLLLITGDGSSNLIFFPLLLVVKAGDADVEFSGEKGYRRYMQKLSRFTWKKLSKGTAGEVAQAVFHAMFGTALEDLGVLGQITTQADWETRKDIDAAYQTKEAQHVNFIPIGFKYIPNTDVPRPQPTSEVSDTRKRKYSEFVAYIDSRIVYRTDVASLSSSIARLIGDYVKKIQSGALENVGTCGWIQPDGSDSNGFIAVESGKYFYT